MIAVLAFMPALVYAESADISITYFHGIRFFNVGDTLTIINTDTKPHIIGGHTANGFNFNSGTIEPNQNYTISFTSVGDYYVFDYADSSINATYTVLPTNTATPHINEGNNGNNQTIVFGDSNATLVYTYSNSTLVLNPSNYTVSSGSPNPVTSDYASPTIANNPIPSTPSQGVQTPQTAAPTITLSVSISSNTLAKADALRAFLGLPPLESVYQFTVTP